MKMNRLILPVIFMAYLLFSAACKSAKDPAVAQTQLSTSFETVKVSRDSAMLMKAPFRFVVSLISIGGGTSPEVYQGMVTYVESFQKARGKKLQVYAIPWGKEGEVDFCFPLNEINAKEQSEFIEGLKLALKGQELVQYEENRTNRFVKP